MRALLRRLRGTHSGRDSADTNTAESDGVTSGGVTADEVNSGRATSGEATSGEATASEATAGGANSEGETAGRSTSHDLIEFQLLFRRLGSEDVATRREAAQLLSGMQMPLAVRPLVVAYLAHGDPALLDALRPFGRAVTRVARSEAREPSMGGERLARLMHVVGTVGDSGGLDLARSHITHPSPAVGTAAAAAMTSLGDLRGVENLTARLEGARHPERVLALRALESIDAPAAREALQHHLDRYRAAAGAVPASVKVFAPLLLDREADLAGLLAERLSASQDSLNLAIGPVSGAIAERHRGSVAAATADWPMFFSTPRHSPDEQIELLTRARDVARDQSGRRVLLLGPLPSPEGRHPLRHVLTWLPANPYTVRIFYLGPKDYRVVQEWWRYAEDVSEVNTALEVILDLMTLDGDRITEEERILLRHTDAEDRDAFHRALLAHL